MVLEQGEKKIYVYYSNIAIEDLSTVLGTWEDGTGNKIRIYIAEKQENQENQLYASNKVDFTHTIHADIKIGNFTNGFEAKSPRLFTNVEDERFDHTFYKACVAFFEPFPSYGIVEESKPNRWRVKQDHKSSQPVLLIDTKLKQHSNIIFCYQTGYISGTYSSYPIPFKKTSGDVILQEEKEEEETE
ncbi:MAG: hypothetical protein DRJ15_08080, partial [Bacteroidetes bacterium]